MKTNPRPSSETSLSAPVTLITESKGKKIKFELGEDAILVLRIIRFVETKSMGEGRRVSIHELVKFVHEIQKFIHTKKEMEQRYTKETIANLMGVLFVQANIQGHWERPGEIDSYEYSARHLETFIPVGALKLWRNYFKRSA